MVSLQQSITLVNDNNTSNALYDESKLHLSCDEYSKCKSVKLVIEALIYYQSLNVTDNNEDHKAQLVELCNNKYPQIIDHYIHILDEHNNPNDLPKIQEFMQKKDEYMACNISNCQLLSRYHRDRRIRTNTPNNTNNNDFVFWRDIMDQIHCFLCHIYDTGMRIHQNEIINEIEEKYDNEQEAKKGEWYDKTFANIVNVISKKKDKLNQSSTDSLSLQSNKYNIIGHGKKQSEGTFITFIALPKHKALQITTINIF